MKTLDEVIKNFEICRKARLNLISCDGCTYAIGDNDFCIDCNEIDVLEWLKGYQKHIELDKLRDKYGETSQITCPKCHSEFVILPDANNPLTMEYFSKLIDTEPIWCEKLGEWYLFLAYDDGENGIQLMSDKGDIETFDEEDLEKYPLYRRKNESTDSN